MQLLFWVLQITVWPALCYVIKHVETRKVQLFLENNGELDNSAQIPNCGPASRIFLNSYTYNRLQCSRSACNSVQEEALSEATVFQLHQNCSFRHKCENLNFPVPRSLRNVYNDILAVTIQYQCLGDNNKILNMCEKHKMNFTGTLHLTFKYYTQTVKDCVCWVNNGAFTLTIMDLRLKARNGDECSSAEFFINGHLYTCDLQSNSYGAKFAEIVKDGLPLGAFISLVPNSNTSLPEMVWISFSPEETSEIECHGVSIATKKPSNMVTVPTKQWLSTKSVAEVVETTEKLQPSLTTSENLSTISTAPLPPPGSNNSGLIIAIVILSLLLVGVSGMLGISLRGKIKRYIKAQRENRNRRNPNNHNDNQGENENTSLLITAETIPVVAEPTLIVDETTPFTTDPTPIVTETTLVAAEPTPIVKEPTPIVKEPTPIVKEPTPIVKEPTPIVKEPTPIVKEPTPIVKEPTPIVTETTPIVTEPTPIVIETTPIVIETTPIVTETTPIVTEMTPIVTEPTPIVTETAPIVTETTQIVTETTPIVTETTPIVTEPTPIVIETTPIVTETTPIVTETTPIVTEPTPIFTATTPIVTETTQIVTETTPIAETTPIVTEPTSIVTEAAPIVTETTPIVTETTPIVTETTPIVTIVTETTPDVTETTQIVTETTPIAEMTPIVTEPTSIVNEAAPVVTATTPIVTETTPIVTETTPIVTIVTETTPDVTETTKHPDDETKRDLTRSEICPIEEEFMPDLNQNENVLSYRSLPNRLVAPAKIPDPSRPGTPTHTKTLDFSGADEKEAGDDITDLGVNDGSHGMMGLILAKNATADNDSESDTDGNEQRNLLDDVMIFVTETKNSSRR